VSVHAALVNAIRKAQALTPKPAATNTMTMTDDEVIRMMFTNVRGSQQDMRGLQLSQGGLAIMKSFFKSYPVAFPDQQVFSSRHILYLDRMCKMPWSADNTLPVTITFFEPDLAMRAKLVGDLDVLLTAFTI
jgi:hypothetical protein